MYNRTPAFRFTIRPFGRIDDGVQLSITVRRVDGDADGGPFGHRTSSEGVPLEEMAAWLTTVLGRMRAADDPDRPQPVPADPQFPRAGGWLFSEGLMSCP